MSNLKAQQSEATRNTLIRVARSLFGKQGYDGVGTEDIVQRAKVTRGALYHQFADKRALFEAVVETVMREMHDHLAKSAAAAGRDPWRALALGIDAFLAASGKPEFQRIALLDAPSVLGWQRWREMDSQFGLGLLERVLSAAMDAGQIPSQPVRATAHLLLAALAEAALLIAHGESSVPADVRQSLERLLAGIQAR